MTIEVLTVAGRAKPIDLLLFQRYRREVAGLVEATYDQNPGLADLGPILPLGTKVRVTQPAPPPAVPIRKLVRLYE